MIEEIYKDIIKTYGSCEQPDWSFVKKRIREGCYDDLVKNLVEIGSVQETTDPNDDISRCFFINSGIESLSLRLSFIGKYACVHDTEGQFFSETDLLHNALGEKVLNILKLGKMKLIGMPLLEKEMCFGGKSLMVYEILFSEDGLLS